MDRFRNRALLPGLGLFVAALALVVATDQLLSVQPALGRSGPASRPSPPVQRPHTQTRSAPPKLKTTHQPKISRPTFVKRAYDAVKSLFRSRTPMTASRPRISAKQTPISKDRNSLLQTKDMYAADQRPLAQANPQLTPAAGALGNPLSDAFLATYPNVKQQLRLGRALASTSVNDSTANNQAYMPTGTFVPMRSAAGAVAPIPANVGNVVLSPNSAPVPVKTGGGNIAAVQGAGSVPPRGADGNGAAPYGKLPRFKDVKEQVVGKLPNNRDGNAASGYGRIPRVKDPEERVIGKLPSNPGANPPKPLPRLPASKEIVYQPLPSTQSASTKFPNSKKPRQLKPGEKYTAAEIAQFAINDREFKAAAREIYQQATRTVGGLRDPQ